MKRMRGHCWTSTMKIGNLPIGSSNVSWSLAVRFMLKSLAGFLMFKSEEGGSLTFEENWRPENPRDMVLFTCSSLIAVVNVNGSPVIQFSRFSVKEYLTSNRIAKGRVSR